MYVKEAVSFVVRGKDHVNQFRLLWQLARAPQEKSEEANSGILNLKYARAGVR